MTSSPRALRMKVSRLARSLVVWENHPRTLEIVSNITLRSEALRKCRFLIGHRLLVVLIAYPPSFKKNQKKSSSFPASASSS